MRGQLERLDKKIEVGRLLAAARKLDEGGKVEAAIAAYEDVLVADASNAEARERLADLRAKPATEQPATTGVAISIKSEPVADLVIDGISTGTTPFDSTLALGKHEVEISAEGYESWQETIEVKAADNLPISVKLKKSDRKTPRPLPGTTTTPPPDTTTTPPPDTKKPDSPFLPTDKGKKNDGPFLPTEK
jgi:hypothetical protein